MRDNNYQRIEASVDAQQAWTQHVHDVAEGLLLMKTRSWFHGLNSNLPDRDKPRLLVYAGGAPRYRDRCDEVARSGYAGFKLS